MPVRLGDTFTQRVHRAHIYFTHYALFEEPDPGIPAALYIDAATGQPTQELVLTSPIYERVFTRKHPGSPDLTAPTQTSRFLPYFVSPPGFPPVPAPLPVIELIALLSGLTPGEVQANTVPLVVAIGQVLAEGQTTGRLTGTTFEVDKTMRFQVRVRLGFIFVAPPNSGQSIAVLTSYLDLGTLHALLGIAPPMDPTTLVLYDWTAPMTLSTRNKYVRQIATEPPPRADGFPPGLREIRFEGSDLEDNGHYRIVGHAAPADVTFTAPPELEQFLFGTTSLTDVEFAIMEAGRLAPLLEVSTIEFNTDQWPACFIKIDGEQTPADFEGYIATFNGLYERGERFAIITYLKRYSVSAEHIARVGRWFQETEPLIHRYMASNAIVSASAGFRFVLSAVYLIKPLPVPSRVCATPEEALAFTRQSWRGPASLGMMRWPYDPGRPARASKSTTLP